jgi:hypothetical protein
VDGVITIMGLGEGFGRAVESEQSAGFSVEDVVPEAGFGSQAFREGLAWECHEVAEVADSPKFEDGDRFFSAAE